METKKFVSYELKADEGDGNTIVGYGSVFGNVDRGGDIVAPGAFAKSIASGRKVKMLWQHDSEKPIGVWEVITEDEKGLKVEGRFANTQKAVEARELVKMGAIDGLSIGYRITDSEFDKDGNRLIKEAELWEISVVTFAMNESATIDAVKAAEMTKTELERFLTGAGMSRSVAKTLIAKGYAGINQNTLREAEDISDDVNENSIIDQKTFDEICELINRRNDILR